MAAMNKVNVLMVGTGEYTTGYVGGKAADSDKGAGVVALTMFDLRRREKVERVGMCGVNVSLGWIGFPGSKALATLMDYRPYLAPTPSVFVSNHPYSISYVYMYT